MGAGSTIFSKMTRMRSSTWTHPQSSITQCDKFVGQSCDWGRCTKQVVSRTVTQFLSCTTVSKMWEWTYNSAFRLLLASLEGFMNNPGGWKSTHLWCAFVPWRDAVTELKGSTYDIKVSSPCSSLLRWSDDIWSVRLSLKTLSVFVEVTISSQKCVLCNLQKLSLFFCFI